MKSVDEPYARNGPVRFDEGRQDKPVVYSIKEMHEQGMSVSEMASHRLERAEEKKRSGTAH